MTPKPSLETLVRYHIPDHLIASVQAWSEAMEAKAFEAARLIACDDLPGLVIMLQHVTPTEAETEAATSTEVH
jgi:hypothetical protein